MAYYEDGSDFPEFGPGAFKAVGWLSKRHSYAHAHLNEDRQSTAEVFDKLCHLCAQPWQPATIGGGHSCDLCRFTEGTSVANYHGYAIAGTSAKVVLVPGLNVIYVAPVGILHYMDAHDYVPPFDFVTAALHCPPMRSSAYFQALMENGARELVRHPHH